jgi:acyl carrier protein
LSSRSLIRETGDEQPYPLRSGCTGRIDICCGEYSLGRILEGPCFARRLPPSSMKDSAARLEEEVLTVLSDYLGVPASELKPEKSLEELGADSLDFAEILFEIEDKFEIKSPLELPELRAKIHSVGDVLRLTADLVATKKA